MNILQAEKRNESLKAKKLRQAGVIPGCVYGSNLEENLLIQIPQGEVNQLLRSKAKGSKVTLDIEGKKIIALLKEISRSAVGGQIENLSFQSLVADEKVTGTAQIVLLNKEDEENLTQQLLYDISYRAFPSNLVERIEVNLEGMQAGSCVKVEDLEIAKNPDVELLVAPDSIVVNIFENKKNIFIEPEAEQAEEE